MDQLNLLEEFAKQFFTLQFFWVVVAVTITLEILKGLPFAKRMNKDTYPYHTLWITALWLLLKTSFTGDWREILANFFFTVFIIDVFYTFAGKRIMAGIIWVFKKFVGNSAEIDEEIKNNDKGAGT